MPGEKEFANMNVKPRPLKRMISAIGLTLLASLAIGAIGVASASAATQHWYTCKNVGEGKGPYAPFCGKEGPPFSYKLSKLPEGSPTGLTMNGTTNFALNWTISGAPFAISCSSQSGEGSIENPTGGLAGKAYTTSFVLSGCTVSSPPASGCKVKTGKIPFFVYANSATEFEGKPAVKFAPSSSLTEFSFEGCVNKALNTTRQFNGTFTGIMNNETSSLEFTKASSNIVFAGGKVTLEGTSKIETSAGDTLRLAP
jgi:hypothetical protein